MSHRAFGNKLRSLWLLGGRYLLGEVSEKRLCLFGEVSSEVPLRESVWPTLGEVNLAEGSQDFYARFWSTIYIVSTPTCFCGPELVQRCATCFPCVLRAACCSELRAAAFCPAEGPPPPPPCPPGLHRSRRKKPVCFFAPFPLSALFFLSLPVFDLPQPLGHLLSHTVQEGNGSWFPSPSSFIFVLWPRPNTAPPRALSSPLSAKPGIRGVTWGLRHVSGQYGRWTTSRGASNRSKFDSNLHIVFLPGQLPRFC